MPGFNVLFVLVIFVVPFVVLVEVVVFVGIVVGVVIGSSSETRSVATWLPSRDRPHAGRPRVRILGRLPYSRAHRSTATPGVATCTSHLFVESASRACGSRVSPGVRVARATVSHWHLPDLTACAGRVTGDAVGD